MKNNKFKLSIIFSIIIIVISYFLFNLIFKDNGFTNLKTLLNNEQKQLIKKYILPYRLISQQEVKISHQKKELKILKTKLEAYKNKDVKDITISKSSIKLLDNKILEKYKLNSGFYFGIHEKTPGSGYIDFFENNIFILSSRGVLAYRKNLSDDKINFKKIKNNINDFIGINQFEKEQWFSLKDILIDKNQVYISYTEEIREDCWNTSVISGIINYERIVFKRLFSPKECIHSINNVDKIFNAHQSGGRIISFDDSNILLSIGDYRSRHFAQDKDSINGKIIKININNSNYKIISMGHRNPQGLYFDKERNLILETEHGPLGGDEINLIEVDKINEQKIQNYGWAIASAGEHYGGKSEKNLKIYEKYPLFKSHSDHGFIEPLKTFVPSIAISEIVKIGKNKYVLGSMGKNREGDKSLYFFELNNEKKIINLEQVKVFERIRDLSFKDNKLYLFMEDTPSIGVINLN
jgi:hypothetical protein